MNGKTWANILIITGVIAILLSIFYYMRYQSNYYQTSKSIAEILLFIGILLIIGGFILWAMSKKQKKSK